MLPIPLQFSRHSGYDRAQRNRTSVPLVEKPSAPKRGWRIGEKFGDLLMPMLERSLPILHHSWDEQLGYDRSEREPAVPR